MIEYQPVLVDLDKTDKRQSRLVLDQVPMPPMPWSMIRVWQGVGVSFGCGNTHAIICMIIISITYTHRVRWTHTGALTSNMKREHWCLTKFGTLKAEDPSNRSTFKPQKPTFMYVFGLVLGSEVGQSVVQREGGAGLAASSGSQLHSS